MGKMFKSTILSIILASVTTIGFTKENFILDTKYYPASGEEKNVAIMLFGGSDGGYPDYYDTKTLTAQGYPCLLVGYFQTENTPERLDLIPLEYFEEAIKAFKSYPGIGRKKIVVWGGSKGGELVLLLASKYKQIDGVIASAPSSVVFQGMGPKPTSSWSYKREPIPFVPYAPFDFDSVPYPLFRELYEASLNQNKAVRDAAIPVENINGPILMISGKDDLVWPASRMGDMVTHRLENYNFPHWYKHLAYENAGHSFPFGPEWGGTIEGNKKALLDSQQKIFNFLKMLSNE